MSYAESESIVVAVDASGDATVYSSRSYTGVVRAVIYTKTDYADTADFTITGETTGQNIWTEANVTASKTVCPRQAVYTTAGVAALYASGGVAVLADVVLVNERIKIIVAQGGTSKTGTFRVVIG